MMIPKIDPNYCKGCDLCSKVCPRNVYEKGEEPSANGYLVPKVARPEACLNHMKDRLACEKCVMTCPDRAIEIVEE